MAENNISREDAWIARMQHYLFVEAPMETGDPVKAASEIVTNFLNRNDGWSDFPFEDGTSCAKSEPPNKDLTVSKLGISPDFRKIR